MAFLHLAPSGKFHIGFRCGGRQWKQSLNTTNPQHAEKARLRLEENLRLVKEGRLDIPAGVDVVEFLLYDGKLTFAVPPPPAAHVQSGNVSIPLSNAGPGTQPRLEEADQVKAEGNIATNGQHPSNGKPPAAGKLATPLEEVFKAYRNALPNDALAESTLRTANIHFGHLKRVLGADTPLAAIDHGRLQEYVKKRATEKGRRGKPLSAVTIEKELGTLSSVWSFAQKNEYGVVAFPGKELDYPKTIQKPEFQTMAQVEQKIRLGHLSKEEEHELWSSVFLTLGELDNLLQHVRRKALHPFLYPTVVFAAHTGARLSEIRKCQLQDLDWDNKRIVIREQKRVPGKHTRRSVPMSPLLESVLRKWLAIHPGGRYTFCLGPLVSKSSKARAESTPLTDGEARHHLQQVLRGSKWEKLSGWHLFRHSFCSNSCAKGVPQRMINRWVGHQSSEMVARYQHLIPGKEHAAKLRNITVKNCFVLLGQVMSSIERAFTQLSRASDMTRLYGTKPRYGDQTHLLAKLISKKTEKDLAHDHTILKKEKSYEQSQTL